MHERRMWTLPIARVVLLLIILNIPSNVSADPSVPALPTIKDAHFRLSFEGFTLGMTSAEVVNVLSNRSGSIWSTFKRPCVNDYAQAADAGLRPSEAPQHCTQMILYREGSREYDLAFIEDYPDNPGSAILISLNITPSQDQVELDGKLTSEVLSAYGTPTVTDGHSPWNGAMWCAALCKMTDWNTVGSGAMAYFERGQQFNLGDNAYSESRYDAIKRFLKSHKIDAGP